MNEMLSLANIHVPERSINTFEGGSKSFDLEWFDDQDGAGKKKKSKGKKKSSKKKKSKSCGLIPLSGGAKKKKSKKSKKSKGKKKKSKKSKKQQCGGVIRYDDEFNEF